MNYLQLLKEWYVVAVSYGGSVAMPLFVSTLGCIVLCVTLVAYYIRTGRVPALFAHRWGFVVGLAAPWSMHACILWWCFEKIECFDRIWGSHATSTRAEFFNESFAIHRAAVGMGLMSTLCLVLATCVLLRGLSHDSRKV
jgi:hypothetical protein